MLFNAASSQAQAGFTRIGGTFPEWFLAKEIPLFKDHEVSEDYREPAIRTGYRPEHSSALQCIASLFRATNETVNFWTHFIPSWYFVWKLYAVWVDMASDTFAWSYLAYLLTACTFPFISCLAHAFSSLSVRARHICYFLDYSALSIFGFGSGLLYRSYCLPNSMYSNSHYNVYLYGCIVNVFVCTTMACVSRFTTNLISLKILRLGAFVIPYVWDNAPVIYRLTYDCNDAACESSADLHARQYVSMLLACFFYGSHIPEILSPGRFDIIGNSHNILHICGILATYAQLHAAHLDLENRRYFLTSNGFDISGFHALLIATTVIAMNVLVVGIFTVHVFRVVPADPPKVKCFAECNGNTVDQDLCTRQSYSKVKSL